MKRAIQSNLCFLALLIWGGIIPGCSNKNETSNPEIVENHVFKEYFSGERSILISGHRGGRGVGIPENCWNTFEVITNEMPVFFEIDPRLTKDSVIVLLHDESLERTTNGIGKLSDYTWEEVQQFYLKDLYGEVTTHKIPKLEDVLLWSKGKTVLNLVKKDVPMEMIVELIRKCDAEKYIMLTVHTGAQARYYYDRFPNIMLSAFVRNAKEYEDMSISGVPWENMIAYVGATINEKNKDIVEKLHQKNVKCMISVAPTHDRLEDREERIKAYREEIAKKPDIIESDFPLDVWFALNNK